LVVKIDANHGDNGEAGKSLFIGREKELDEIIDDVKSNKGTRLLLVGGSGIGKTALLDRFTGYLERRRRDRLTY
jgi:ATP-dependent Clp protease ATP-binding subunit ClpA